MNAKQRTQYNLEREARVRAIFERENVISIPIKFEITTEEVKWEWEKEDGKCN